MMGKLVELKSEKAHYEPKRWLIELAERIEHDFPDVERLVVVIGSSADSDGQMAYAKTSNGLRRDEVLWMLEMGKEALLRPDK
jgi:hypothetical protein